MQYQLNMKKEPGYLYVQVTGIRTPETVMAMGKEVIAECDARKYSRALVNVQGMKGGLKTFDAYKLGTEDLKQLRRPGRIKVSIVDLEENQNRFRFLETVVHNQGFNLSIFSNVDEAITWLCEGATFPD